MKSAGVIPATVPVPELEEPGHLLLIHVSIVELLMLTHLIPASFLEIPSVHGAFSQPSYGWKSSVYPFLGFWRQKKCIGELLPAIIGYDCAITPPQSPPRHHQCLAGGAGGARQFRVNGNGTTRFLAQATGPLEVPVPWMPLVTPQGPIGCTSWGSDRLRFVDQTWWTKLFNPR